MNPLLAIHFTPHVLAFEYRPRWWEFWKVGGIVQLVVAPRTLLEFGTLPNTSKLDALVHIAYRNGSRYDPRRIVWWWVESLTGIPLPVDGYWGHGPAWKGSKHGRDQAN